MSANPELVKERGVSDSNVQRINLIHETLEYLLDHMTVKNDIGWLLTAVRNYEFALQRLWGFPEDRRYHTWTERMRKRHRELSYVGRIYRYNPTGEQRTVSSEFVHGRLFGVGKGFVDFGDVVRIVGDISEVDNA